VQDNIRIQRRKGVIHLRYGIGFGHVPEILMVDAILVG
jgi:hypothetical protein